MTHTLTVNGTGDFIANATISGHDDQCVVWTTCDECGDAPDTDTIERHGVEHRAIEGVWCINTGECAVTATLEGVKGVNKIASRRGIGEWPIDVQYLDGVWYVEDVTLANTLRTVEDAMGRAAKSDTESADLSREDLLTVWRELMYAVD